MMEQPLASLSSFVGYFRQPEVSAGSFKLLFAALVIASAFCATYVGSRAVFSAPDLRSVAVLGAVVSGLLLLGALIALRPKTAANAALALVTLDACSRRT